MVGWGKNEPWSENLDVKMALSLHEKRKETAGERRIPMGERRTRRNENSIALYKETLRERSKSNGRGVGWRI